MAINSKASRNPYQDNVALDDTNDTVFLGESEDEDDEFFFNPLKTPAVTSPSASTPTVAVVGEFKNLPDTQERIYISKPPWEQKDAPADAEVHGFSMLLLLTNGLGIESEPNQRLADEFAREGYFVVMPDLFFSDPNAPLPLSQSQAGGLLSRIKSLAVSSAAGFMTDMWVARHTEERTWPMLVHMIDEIVELYRPRNICVVGYSFGARYALKLLQLPVSKPEPAPVNTNAVAPAEPPVTVDLSNPSWARLIVTGIACHPSLVEAKDLVGIKKPVLFIAVQDDPLFPLELINVGTRELSRNTVFYDLKWYDRKLPHGFAVKGDYPDNQLIRENQARVHVEVVSWIKSFMA